MKLPNNYGAISRLSGNRRRPFMVRKHLGGGRYIVIGYYETKAAALEALAVYNKAQEPKPLTTLATLYKEWLALHSNAVSAATVRGYHSAYIHIQAIATRPIDRLTFDDYQQAISAIAGGYATRKKVRTLINNLIAYANKKGLTVKPVGQLLELGKHKAIRPHKPMTRQSINKLWLDPKSNDIILILLYTGMRCGELLALTRKDINRRRRTITVTRSKTQAGTGRVIPIHPRILPLIEARYSRPGALFDESYNAVRALFKKATNGRHTTHDCRHTVASLLDSAGANPTAVRAILGHKHGDITTRVYTHKRLRELRRTIELLR